MKVIVIVIVIFVLILTITTYLLVIANAPFSREEEYREAMYNYYHKEKKKGEK